MTVDIEEIAEVRREGEIWYSPSQTPVSYPSDAHLVLAQVEDSSFWFRHRNDLILALIERFGAGELFLDIGGGRGFVSRALQVAGIPAVLVEPDESASRIAHERGVDPVVCGTFQDAKFQPEVADAVGMFDVVEHIEDSVAFLRSANRLLKPGGRLFATVPSYQWLWSAEDEYAGHFRRYTPATLEVELTAAGFEVEYLSYAFAFLVAPVFLLRTLPSKLGLRGTDPADSADEHQSEGISRRILDRFCEVELARVRDGRTIPAGTSLIVVARKPEN